MILLNIIFWDKKHENPFLFINNNDHVKKINNNMNNINNNNRTI